MQRVFLDHDLKAEFGDDHHMILDPDGRTLLVLGPPDEDGSRPVVRRFEHGGWHSAGTVACGFRLPSSACQNCSRGEP